MTDRNFLVFIYLASSLILLSSIIINTTNPTFLRHFHDTILLLL
jgi:hypothetical protein